MSLWGISFFYLSFISGFLSFVFFHYHYLYLLLSLELIMVSLFFLFYLSGPFGSGGFSILVFFLIFFVCESVLGISILISQVRGIGNEMFGV
uniref:NADH dehydrogenase subunit 4L n=1 Tax=Hygrobates turcicus TaxID=2028090 RepID=UPI002237098A|nr:NADH dehydrogenase subunit 4L [Hygrobates turcicus]UYS90927.1 NADH dehydrogenase subunit 4L [Hygrobates turcicus]